MSHVIPNIVRRNKQSNKQSQLNADNAVLTSLLLTVVLLKVGGVISGEVSNMR